MNHKRSFKTDYRPEFLHEIAVTRVSKTYTLTKDMEVSVYPRTNLPAGRYRFRYAESTNDGQLLIYVEGPVRRSTSRIRTIRQSDIKSVHLKTRNNNRSGNDRS